MSSTIKGQNIRIAVGRKCVAAATSCTLHISADLVDATTKDTPDGWKRQVCVGKNWDAQVDALVVSNPFSDITQAFDAGIGMTVDGKNLRVVSHLIYLKKGDKLAIYATRTSDNEYSQEIYVIDEAGTTYKPAETSGNYEEFIDCAVYIAVPNTASAQFSYNVVETENSKVSVEKFVNWLLLGQTVSVALTTTSGDNNDVTGRVLHSKTAIVQDITITSANRQSVVASCKLIGA